MAQLSKAELDEIFVDVRKGFRLLYYYQRRVLDTIKFIGDTLSKNVISGYSLFSNNAPRNGSRINLDSWAWDWLNMYAYEFYFQPETINGNTYQFAVAIQSDTGYDDTEAGVAPTSVELYKLPEESETKIYFYIGKNMWKPTQFEDAWGKDANDEFKPLPEENKCFISKRFDLSDFKDDEAILQKLKEVKKFFEDNGIVDFISI